MNGLKRLTNNVFAKPHNYYCAITRGKEKRNDLERKTKRMDPSYESGLVPFEKMGAHTTFCISKIFLLDFKIY